MKLDAYGRQLEILRESELWVIYEVGEGKKSCSHDISIPPDYNEKQVLTYLEDLFHERATPDRPKIKVIGD